MGIDFGTVRAQTGYRHVVLRDVEGHLQIRSSLPPGRYAIAARDDDDRPVSGYFLVGEGGESEHPVYMLRMESWVFEHRADQNPLRIGYGVYLETTSSRARYKLRFETGTLDNDGAPRTAHATLARLPWGYYLACTDVDGDGSTARGASLHELMIEHVDVYRQFEELAAACSLLHYGFVPESEYSPAVVAEVMSYATPPADAATLARWSRAVDALDSEFFAAREAASRELLSEGEGVAAFLRSVDPSKLSLEQSARIDHVLRSIEFARQQAQFPISAVDLDELRRAPSPEWYQRLSTSSDEKVSHWARESLRELGDRSDTDP